MKGFSKQVSSADTPRSSAIVDDPKFRRIRGFALDPGASQSISTAIVSKMTFRVPWEPLEPGPIGEYVEVIDYDPASKCFYEPVSLDDPLLLAQDGHAPAEGNPQFHQQMTYAVVMSTIQTFERAQGRPAMWADTKNHKFVQRLRIYPHALREANAYYSPEKKALLFGYFPASADPSIGQFPGGMVFTCLSHDIIAHETAHALLDGCHRSLLTPTNDDVLAFHEAFSDIVALFQRFSFKEVLAHQIASTQGNLSAPNLMAKLATQFGHAIGARGALRDAIGHIDPSTGRWSRTEADPTKLEQTLEPHDRGAILVAAIFDTFVQIYLSRTSDLIRIATGGSGVLPAGDIHPDLVARLSEEASEIATHVLRMCIRALDYCPPVDLTFGEFLRALITADLDLMPEDPLGYRVAFIEAFRRRGIFPDRVKTMSEDSLRWNRTNEQDLAPEDHEALQELMVPIIESIQEIRSIPAGKNAYRRKLWEAAADARGALNRRIGNSMSKSRAISKITGLALQEEFLSTPEGVEIERYSRKFELRTLLESRRERDDGSFSNQLFMTLIQRQKVNTQGEEFTVECGCTLVVDLDAHEITYAIRKGLNSDGRIGRMVEFTERLAGSSLGETYLRGDSESLAALHRHS